MFLHLYTGNRIELQNVLLFWELEEMEEFELPFYYLLFTNCTNSSFHYSKEDRSSSYLLQRGTSHKENYHNSKLAPLVVITPILSPYRHVLYLYRVRFKIGRFFDSSPLEKKEKAKEEACARGWKTIWWGVAGQEIVEDASKPGRGIEGGGSFEIYMDVLNHIELCSIT